MRNFTLLFCLLFVVIATKLNAQVVTTAVPFLRIAPDARSGGIADNGIATTSDAYSTYWNPAKFVFDKSEQDIAATYVPWFSNDVTKNFFLASVAGHYNLKKDNYSIGGLFRYCRYGNYTLTNENGENIGTLVPNDWALDFSGAMRLSKSNSLSVTLKFINSNIDRKNILGENLSSASAVAGDICFYHHAKKYNEGLSWGVRIANLGGKMTYNSVNTNFIPATIGAGVSYAVPVEATNTLRFSLDINKYLVPVPPEKFVDVAVDNTALKEYTNQSVVGSWFKSFGKNNGAIKNLQYSFAAEFEHQMFGFRAGYYFSPKTSGFNQSYLSVGANVNYKKQSIFISYIIPSGSGVNKNILSNVLRFGIAVNVHKQKTK